MKPHIKSSVLAKLFFLLLIIIYANQSFSQGQNHSWLIGYDIWPKGRMLFDDTSYTFLTETRKMQFLGTEGNISGANGNFLMSCNGEWIANASNDTMMNGAGLVPGSGDGLLLPHACLILPYPGDTNKFAIFHHTANLLGPYYKVTELLKTVVDITLDSGLGGVLIKSDTLINDTLNSGITACKHSNGRDWWIVAQKDSSNTFYILLLTPNGITNITTQNLNVFPLPWSNACQPTFSPDGNKFSYSYYDDMLNHTVFLFDFDRCTGTFSNPQTIDITDGHLGFGLAFSPNSQFVYATSSVHVFQINTATLNVDTVSVIDTFYSNGFLMNYFLMYLAANGKIYITSGNSVQHLHFINYPDSAGVACDVQQHAINLGIWSFRAVPNHPNYYLGCDTASGCTCLTTGIEQLESHNFKFSLSPNPNNGNFNILYLLPQNKKGQLEIYDINGRRIFEMNLPPWSTMQNISLPTTIADGIYNCVISSGNSRVNKKLVVIRN